MIVAVVVAAIGLDIALADGTMLLFALRKLIDLVDYLAFWR